MAGEDIYDIIRLTVMIAITLLISFCVFAQRITRAGAMAETEFLIQPSVASLWKIWWADMPFVGASGGGKARQTAGDDGLGAAWYQEWVAPVCIAGDDGLGAAWYHQECLSPVCTALWSPDDA